MKTKFIGALIVLFSSFFNAQFINAQTNAQNNKETTDPCENKVEYDDLMSGIFPEYFLGSGNAHTMFLRYDMDYISETQINFLFSTRGKSEIYLYQSVGKSIHQQLYEIKEKNCNLPYSEIVKQIKIKKIKINLAEDEIKKIRTDFSKAVINSLIFEDKQYQTINPNLATIILHAPFYRVRYSGSGGIALSGEGNSINEKPLEDEPPFIEWMREVYRLIESKIEK